MERRLWAGLAALLAFTACAVLVASPAHRDYILAALWSPLSSRHEVAQGVTKERLLAVHRGISEADLIELLGEPLAKKEYRAGDGGGALETWWTYGRPRQPYLEGIELQVIVRNGRVVNLHGQQSDVNFISMGADGRVRVTAHPSWPFQHVIPN